MPTFTVTYSSDSNEFTTSTADDRVGAPPPFKGPATFDTNADYPNTDIHDAAPPPIHGLGPIAVDGWQGNPSEAPPAVPGFADAVVPSQEPDDLSEFGPPPIG